MQASQPTPTQATAAGDSTAAASPPPEEPRLPFIPPLGTFRGKATYYSDRLAGRRTASGSRYDPRAYTAAHRTFPFGTVVRVTRMDTRKHVQVTITDRGPFGSAERIIDLSRAAAEKIEMMRAGVVPVQIDVLKYGDERRGP